VSNPPPPPGSEPTGPGEPNPSTPGPAQPPYGQPAYGQPQPPYGQPPAGPGIPAYGQGGSAQQPSKGLAIAALVLAIPCLITNLISLVLAIVVLAGKKGGKGLAIAAIVIDVIVLVVGTLLVVGVILLAGTPVDDLKTGQCITADGLDEDGESVSRIEVVSCSESHDGEVLVAHTLTADEADAYPDQTIEESCLPLVAPELLTSLPDDVVVNSLTQSAEPESGDHLVCVASQSDGDELTEKLG
jgi:hypothetical protein